MAKTPTEPTGRSRAAGTAKRAKTAKRARKAAATRTRRAAAAPAEIDAEAHVDGCTCDVEFDAQAATSDADLPEARGGVEVLRAPRRRAAAGGG